MFSPYACTTLNTTSSIVLTRQKQCRAGDTLAKRTTENSSSRKHNKKSFANRTWKLLGYPCNLPLLSVLSTQSAVSAVTDFRTRGPPRIHRRSISSGNLDRAMECVNVNLCRPRPEQSEQVVPMYLPRVIRPHPPTSGTSDGTMAIREKRSEPSMTITCLVYSAGFFLFCFSPRILVTVRSLVGHMYRSRSRQQKKRTFA